MKFDLSGWNFHVPASGFLFCATADCGSATANAAIVAAAANRANMTRAEFIGLSLIQAIWSWLRPGAQARAASL
jgi:hypothetical protein